MDSRSASPRAGIIQPELVVETTESSGRLSIARRSSPANNPPRSIDRNVHGALCRSCIRGAYLATQLGETITIRVCLTCIVNGFAIASC